MHYSQGLPVYSDLCRTDREAYLEYLRAYQDVIAKVPKLSGVARELLVGVGVESLARDGLSGGSFVAAGMAVDAVGRVEIESPLDCQQSGRTVVECVCGANVARVNVDIDSGRLEYVDGRSVGTSGEHAGGAGERVEAKSGESRVERNRRWRAEKKERKKKRKSLGLVRRSSRQGFFSECSEEVQQGLRQSRAELLVEQNKLALLKAKRGLKVLEDSDVNEEVRRYRTSIRASTEKNMVSIEKTHATLKATGNVPGFAETVVSDGGIPTPGLTADGTGNCSITPDSSASQAEFRACQKALLDSEKRVVELEEALKKFGVTLSMSKNMDKETFTDDTAGNDLFAEFYPNGEVVHYVDRNGKKKFKVGEEYVVHDFKKMKETMGDEAWKEFLKT